MVQPSNGISLWTNVHWPPLPDPSVATPRPPISEENNKVVSLPPISPTPPDVQAIIPESLLEDWKTVLSQQNYPHAKNSMMEAFIDAENGFIEKDYAKSLKALQRVTHLLPFISQEIQIRWYSNSGVLFNLLGDDKNAMEFFRKGLTLLETHPDSRQSLCIKLVVILRKYARLNECQQVLEEVIKTTVVPTMEILFELGMVCKDLNNWASARIAFVQCLNHRNATPESKALFSLHLGFVQEDGNKAIEIYRNALEKYKPSKSISCELYYHLSYKLNEMRAPPEKIKGFLEKALSLCEPTAKIRPAIYDLISKINNRIQSTTFSTSV